MRSRCESHTLVQNDKRAAWSPTGSPRVQGWRVRGKANASNHVAHPAIPDLLKLAIDGSVNNSRSRGLRTAIRLAPPKPVKAVACGGL